MTDTFHFLSLIGLRGTGKTTVAERLALSLDWTWADADAEVERQAGTSIADIFAMEGEVTFRDLEAKTLADLTRETNCVLATGGGAVLREANRRLLRQAGPVVWLTCDLGTMLARIEADETSHWRRPNLTGHDRATEIKTLLTARKPLYAECASLTIDTNGKSPEAIANEILNRLNAGG